MSSFLNIINLSPIIGSLSDYLVAFPSEHDDFLVGCVPNHFVYDFG